MSIVKFRGMAPITIEVDTDKEKVVITADKKTFSFLSADDREIDCPCCERPPAEDGTGAEVEDTKLIDDAVKIVEKLGYST